MCACIDGVKTLIWTVNFVLKPCFKKFLQTRGMAILLSDVLLSDSNLQKKFLF